MSLYEISGRFKNLYDELDLMIDDDDLSEAWFDTLEGIEGEFDDKAESVALYIKNLTAEAEAIKAEKDVLDKRLKAKTNAVKRLKEYLKLCMEQTSRKKIETPRAVISVRNNPESASISDEHAFIEWAKAQRDDLLRYKEPEISRTAVKEALQAGQDIPYAELARTKSVIIK